MTNERKHVNHTQYSQVWRYKISSQQHTTRSV